MSVDLISSSDDPVILISDRTSDMTIVSVKQETNPVEYLLNVVLPSREYVQFYDAKSDMLNVSHDNSLHTLV